MQNMILTTFGDEINLKLQEKLLLRGRDKRDGGKRASGAGWLWTGAGLWYEGEKLRSDALCAV